MQLFIAALLGALVQAAGTLVGKVLLSLGIGYVVYTGVDASLAWMKAQAVAGFAGAHAQTLAAMGALKVGNQISILFSALTARLTLNGLTSGTIKRMVTK